jgi:hypothetical protein
MFSPGIHNSPAGAGCNNFQGQGVPVINPGASALTQYGVYAFDLASATSGVDTPDERVSNIIAVSTAAMAAGGLLCVAQSAIPAGGQGNVIVFGHTNAKVDGTTDVLVHDPLKAVNATAHLVKATAATDRFHAITLEGYTTAGAATKEVIFDGLGRF